MSPNFFEKDKYRSSLIASQPHIKEKVLRQIMIMKIALKLLLLRDTSGGGVDGSFLDFSIKKISKTFKREVFCYADFNETALCPDPEIGFCDTIFYQSQYLHLKLGRHPWCESHHPDLTGAKVDRVTLDTIPNSPKGDSTIHDFF